VYIYIYIYKTKGELDHLDFKVTKKTTILRDNFQQVNKWRFGITWDVLRKGHNLFFFPFFPWPAAVARLAMWISWKSSTNSPASQESKGSTE
jgi:hypothetical protein